MFEDRQDAGRRLASLLEHYRDANAVVLAIPRGGVEVGYQVAVRLRAELDILVARKLPFPGNPEAGFGAVAEDGSTYIADYAARWFPPALVSRIVAEQRQESARRVNVLRGGRPLPPLEGRVVILVDDGLATGATMRAAIMLCRRRGAARIVVAVPVAGEDVVREMDALADEVVVVLTPPGFRAVAQVYRHWYDVGDEEVLAILDRWRSEQQKRGADAGRS
ncbi:MAG: phosphoribosyltransferase [Anaerolineae bacterium]|nr:phosphoribosyltransferase [Anaerolineae bacterium]